MYYHVSQVQFLTQLVIQWLQTSVAATGVTDTSLTIADRLTLIAHACRFYARHVMQLVCVIFAVMFHVLGLTFIHSHLNFSFSWCFFVCVCACMAISVSRDCWCRCQGVDVS
jgi:hypothetical protein